jgi:signal peptidase I
MNMISKVLDSLSTKIVRINGSSMEPTLPDGSWVLVNRRAYGQSRKPVRFDVVRMENPSRRGHWIIKRIVGLPDEEVRLTDGRLFIDGVETPEPNLTGGGANEGQQHEWWPRAEEYVVLGDNRGASTDSRKFGTVAIGAIRGKVGRRIR